MKKVYISSENKYVYSILEMLKPQLIYIPLKDNELLIKSLQQLVYFFEDIKEKY